VREVAEPFTRRTALRRGALAAAVAAGGAGAYVGSRHDERGDAPARTSATPGRGVAIGPSQDYLADRQRFAETGTPWVRMWADWPRVQPRPDRPPDLAALDRQIDAARDDGRGVVLTAWRFAPWAGGGEDGFQVPGDLSPRAAWGRWIETLVDRFAGRIDALEIMNEPNLQLRPQRGIDAAVATMIETALVVARRHRDAPLLAGPATSDTTERSAARTPYDAFTGALLRRLVARDVDPGDRFAWSHHNYEDVEGDLAGAENRLARTRALLAGRWTGRRRLFVTESGARPDVLAKRFDLGRREAALAKQAELVERAFLRVALGPEGGGDVALVCQYLFVTDRFYDSGLCELDGTPRPAYYAWAGLPTRERG
jgi:hypothetical protein